MANRVASIFERGLKAAEVAHGNPTWQFQGQTLPCITTRLRRGTELVVGGHLKTIDWTLIVRRSQMPTSVPLTMDSELWEMDDPTLSMDQTATYEVHPGRKLIKSGKVYRVLNITETAANGHVEIDVGSASK